MKKIILLYFTIGLLYLLGPGYIQAADFNINCSNDGCSGLNGPIFDEINILPGSNFVKSLKIENNKNEDVSVRMDTVSEEDQDDQFSKVLHIEIYKDLSSIYEGDLYGFSNDRYDLGILGQGDEMNINFEVLFPEEAGNEYQGNITVFDIVYIFTGQESGDTEIVNSGNSTQNSPENDLNVDNKEGEVLGASTESEDEQNLLGKILGLSNTRSGRIFIVYTIITLFIVLGGSLLLFIRSVNWGKEFRIRKIQL